MVPRKKPMNTGLNRFRFISRKSLLQRTVRVPLPQTPEQVPGSVFHNAKRILVAEKRTGELSEKLRVEFERRWGFPWTK